MDTSTMPIAIYCQRKIINEAKYKEDWTAFSNYIFEGTPGVKAIFSVMDKNEAGQALQYSYYKDVGSFLSQPKDQPTLSANLESNYDPESTTDVCQVWGGWDDSVKALANDLPGVHYVFVPVLAGFMRSTGMGITPSKPIIWASKRKVKAGQMAAYGAAIKGLADWWVPNIKGLLAVVCFTSEEDKDAVWDMRVFGNYNAFATHITSAVFPLLGPLGANMNKDVPFTGAVSFSSAGEPEAMIAANKGNAAYTHYTFEEAFGPMPDFNKGD